MEHDETPEEPPPPRPQRRGFTSARMNNLISQAKSQASEKLSAENIQQARERLSPHAEKLGEGARTAFTSGTEKLHSTRESLTPAAAKARENLTETAGQVREKIRWLAEAEVGEDGRLIRPKLVHVSQRLLLAAAILGVLGTLLLSRRFLSGIEGDAAASEEQAALTLPAVWVLVVLAVLALYIGSILALRLRLPLCRVSSTFLAVCGLLGAITLTLGIRAIPGIGWAAGFAVGFGGWVLLASGVLGFAAVAMLWALPPCRQWHAEPRRRRQHRGAISATPPAPAP